MTTKRPAFGPDCAMSSVAVRPSQLSSQTAHRWVLSGSYSSSMSFGNPLAMVATRVKAPVGLVERVGDDLPVLLDTHEEQARAMVGIGGRVVLRTRGLVEEALRDQQVVRDPGDRFQAER